MGGVGDRPHDHPMVLLRQRKHLADQVLGLLRVGADHARNEADIRSCGLRILEHSHPAQGLDHVRDARRVGLLAIAVDPAQHRFRGRQIDGPQLLGGSRRPQIDDDKDDIDDDDDQRPPHPTNHAPPRVLPAQPRRRPKRTTAGGFGLFLPGTWRPCAKVVAGPAQRLPTAIVTGLGACVYDWTNFTPTWPPSRRTTRQRRRNTRTNSSGTSWAPTVSLAPTAEMSQMMQLAGGAPGPTSI